MKELKAAVANVLTQKYGAGFSVNVLWKMRQFFLANPILPMSGELIPGTRTEFGIKRRPPGEAGRRAGQLIGNEKIYDA